MSPYNGEYIDEAMLNKALEIAFGPQAPAAIMKLYNALDDAHEAGHQEGYKAGFNDGFNDYADVPEEDITACMEATADDAQLAMDTIWGHEPTRGALAD